MQNIIEVNYQQTGQSKSTNQYGMREMQQKAFEARNNQYILLKAPPASGKSRALMFIALDKLFNQGVKKAIIAVPERSIGGSFGKTELSKFGFFADWEPNSKYNLCVAGGEKSKVEAFKKFMNDPSEPILICTHATLRFAFEQIEDSTFDNCLLAIDEFHHVSAEENNRLGELIRSIMANSNAHIVAMTGSYFRGDSVPVLTPRDEEQFTKVTYNYYEQLNGYDYLKSLGIGYHFYQGRYTDAIMEVLDTDKKTIIHIPNVNSAESTKDKYKEVDTIMELIGEWQETTDDHVHIVKRYSDGKLLKIADLVEDDQNCRASIDHYLNTHKNIDDMDIIIALGKAKEGFDWPYCEHALTVGYRSSLTEIIQIIGRATRDSDNKTHAQFTNLIAQPEATDDEVKVSVNNMLKAITASLLMEQVLAPNFKFKTKINDEDKAKAGEMKIRGFKEPTSEKVKNIVESDLNDLKASILQDDQMLKAMPSDIDPEIINKVLIPKVIRTKYPELEDSEVEELRQHVVVDSVIKNGEIKEVGDKKFVRMADKFEDIDKLNIDLIDKVNPFQKAFEILSKSITKGVLKAIQETIDASKITMTDEEAILLWPKIQEFVKKYQREPSKDSIDITEVRMAQAIIYLKDKKRKMTSGK
ncbi:DEAD/DEAH box helicase [Francisella tularensis subsp. novicida]|uniref:DEAD/DEAH box helicase n=1 Tax=Francisella tularensis TaxID=263 RepID=UPI0005024D9B|nr:DEAD/DEAH box helicase [Francisella tularensis]AJJ47790.1 DEAD/DEAH box helicase family protein [Francisella tularensis subsp. novicida]KFJ66825.1 DEAD/DEAH box helicase family protein [Francisella tularensis subsp. novicida]MBK2344833.1 DEAD/DEAH box helicase [Francisella tularensis subsp. novicida]MBK2349597.1 DEAD/DEAH box helicase [Francisella tularensis subsp. novicida]MBK2353157.1 DEAD/DEAH box helicase [Francisella tularensis subsp. novicida]